MIKTKTFFKYITWATLPLYFATAVAYAHDAQKNKDYGQAYDVLVNTKDTQEKLIVPKEEYANAQKLLAKGPNKTTGIGKLDILGTVALDGEFNSLDGLQLRARELVINVGGIVAVHQHTHRPGVAYIIEGEMTEYRASAEGPVAKKAGDVAFEKTGVVHWWKNTGTIPARVVVVDIIKAEK